MAGMTEMMAQARERQELVVAATDEIQGALKEIRRVRDDIRQAAQEFDMREFKLRQSYEKLDKAITSETQRLGRLQFFAVAVIGGGVRGAGGVGDSSYRPVRGEFSMSTR